MSAREKAPGGTCAVARMITLKKGCGVGRARIKWPNDVLLNERKVAGILTEQISVAGLPALIIGVGVNVNNSLQGAPDGVQQRATSVFDATGESIDLTELLISILNAIDQSINELGGR